ncbi:hypothetical protein EVAR_37164_1 [Eumeta japonica]|uniref:Uncharacterized protein n=1 Tax=Eumeta variegata TaxID=151549 RepID=A0A4C1WLJ2_EUMVA|nr:hypothetical protein EVAR_37164_1 [Eumeta japonica]
MARTERTAFRYVTISTKIYRLRERAHCRRGARGAGHAPVMSISPGPRSLIFLFRRCPGRLAFINGATIRLPPHLPARPAPRAAPRVAST